MIVLPNGLITNGLAVKQGFFYILKNYGRIQGFLFFSTKKKANLIVQTKTNYKCR
jgi:hypothetical protein